LLFFNCFTILDFYEHYVYKSTAIIYVPCAFFQKFAVVTNGQTDLPTDKENRHIPTDVDIVYEA